MFDLVRRICSGF